MTDITKEILRFETMIKKLTLANNIFLTFGNINSFVHTNSIVIQHL